MTILKVRHKFVRQGLEEAVKTIREEKNQKKQVSSANNNPDHDLHSAHDWLSMSAATTLFGLPAKGIYRLVRRGILKQVKLIHKRIHVSRIEIERLMVMGEDSSDYRQSLSPLPRLSADE